MKKNNEIATTEKRREEREGSSTTQKNEEKQHHPSGERGRQHCQKGMEKHRSPREEREDGEDRKQYHPKGGLGTTTSPFFFNSSSNMILNLLIFHFCYPFNVLIFSVAF